MNILADLSAESVASRSDSVRHESRSILLSARQAGKISAILNILSTINHQEIFPSHSLSHSQRIWTSLRIDVAGEDIRENSSKASSIERKEIDEMPPYSEKIKIVLIPCSSRSHLVP